jgi:hypothetical protein
MGSPLPVKVEENPLFHFSHATITKRKMFRAWILQGK